jgi:hypothetical protein
MTNMQAVFGQDLASQVRDWAVSNAVDDMASTDSVLQQPSWNWHSVYPSPAVNSPYPLPITTMQNATSYSGSVTAGGAAYYKLGVAANASATFSLTQANAGNLQLVIVRTR